MTDHRRPWTRPVACWVLALTVGMFSAAPPPAAARSSSEGGVTSSRIARLARKGRFSQLLKRLGDRPDQMSGNGQQLVDALEHYEAKRTARLKQRRKAYAEAMDKVRGQAEEKLTLQDRLVAAIDARKLSRESKAFVRKPAVKDLIQHADRRARRAEQANDWVRAASIYRLLDLIYAKTPDFHADVKRISRHLHVLELYAPERLEQLYQAERRREQENSQDKEEEEEVESRSRVEKRSWRERLKGVKPSMFRQALAQAARRHIRNGGYKKLLQGSVQGVLTLARTDALARTFDSFRNDRARRRFRERLERINAQLEDPTEKVGFLDAVTLINHVMKLNRQTLDLPQRVLTYEMAEGAMSTLDNFSAIIWPWDKKQFTRSTQGTFSGVGIQITRREGRLVVVSPLPNTPAMKAGVRAGDIIAQVDGEDTATWGLNRVVRKITGPEGTAVTLAIQRQGKPDQLQFKLQRAEIEIESIRGWEHTDSGGWNYWIAPKSGIAYIRLTQFLPQTPDDLDQAISQLQRSGHINGLILDLRFNPGGLLDAAIKVADRFIRQGAIVSTVGGDGQRNSEARAQKRDTYPRFPMAVLINEGSASASEIVSGALQDHDRATIVGTRSFGKGSVQELFPVAHGAAFLKLTTQHYMLPDGRIIHRTPDSDEWGVEPDLKVRMTSEQVSDALEARQAADVIHQNQREPADTQPQASDILQKDLDPQLQAALLVLRAQLFAKGVRMVQVDQDEPAGAR